MDNEIIGGPCQVSGCIDVAGHTGPCSNRRASKRIRKLAAPPQEVPVKRMERQLEAVRALRAELAVHLDKPPAGDVADYIRAQHTLKAWFAERLDEVLEGK